MSTNKSMEEYRRLADKCRETSRTVSAENGRAELLAMAEIWDFLADHVGTRPSLWNGGHRSRSPSSSPRASDAPGDSHNR
jgi:hypothetical protein